MKKIGIVLLVAVMLVLSAAPVAAAPNLQSGAAILIDAESGQILFSKNANQTFYAAGFVKLVNAKVAIDTGDPDKSIITTYKAITGLDPKDSIGLVSGERLKLEDAIYATLIGEAEDAACVAAENLGGTIKSYVSMMNDEADLLGAANFTIATGSGTASEAQVATVTDIALVAKNCLENDKFYKIFTARAHTIPATNVKDSEREITSRHSMVNGEVPCQGVKGGITAFSRTNGHHLMTFAERDGRTLICVTMGAEEQAQGYSDTKALLDYGFDSWQYTTISAGTLKKQLPVAVRSRDIVFTGLPEDGLRLLIPISDQGVSFTYTSGTNENIYLHGSISVSLENAGPSVPSPVATIDFYESNSKGQGGSLVKRIFKILLIVLLVAALIFLAYRLYRYYKVKYRGVPKKPRKSVLKLRNVRKKAGSAVLPKKEWDYLDYHHDWNDREWYDYYRNAQSTQTSERKNREESKAKQPKSNREIFEAQKPTKRRKKNAARDRGSWR